MILIVDHRDSFTYNLAEVLASLGAAVRVVRGAEVDVAAVLALAPAGVVLGPGPGTPASAEPLETLVRELPRHVPTLGVCLGHQAIATAHGGRLVRSPELVHGETREVLHDGRGVFAGLPSPLSLARYNSLAVDEASLAPALDAGLLEISAREANGTIAGLRHCVLPLEGVQGHPESILSVDLGGRELLANFLAAARGGAGARAPGAHGPGAPDRGRVPRGEGPDGRDPARPRP